MKSLKSLLVVTSLVLFSVPSMATSLVPGSKYSVETNQRTLVTPANDSKENAYAEGQQMLNELQQSNPAELGNILKVIAFQPKERASLQIKDNSYVTVQESMNTAGEIEYHGLVNVQYEHLRYDNN
ncbi:DUF3316 domain-containing protein [Photobacterium sp. SDRW27]|uniref:DUF3316 domain-containing protein n=1 Tax=Photobacterium obscurum TaxID=2829490 RepID=UPI00224307B0|nr:DUF3316 domain-containing protein [Photobacterium obscurum]MCW8331385.1 DUF3316 domain-containing protein [Photobacterium obscurum]